MAQFPVEFAQKDSEGLVEAINYALSGPTGLGQNFSGFSDSYTAWLKGNTRIPATVAGYTTPAHGASGSTTITVSNPGSVRQNDSLVPSRIAVGQYAYGTNIGTAAVVDASYDSVNTPWLIPLTVANTGAVQGPVTFYQEAVPILYVAPIAISTITWQDSRTVKVTFASAQPTPPFDIGSLPFVSGSTHYNATYIGPGVVACTTTYVILQSSTDIADVGTGTGGTIKLSNTLQPPSVGTDPGFPSAVYFNATDCGATGIINGVQSRAFISAQIDNTISYTASATSILEYTVALNRFVATISTQASNGTVTTYFDSTIASQSYQYTLPIGSSTLPVEKTVFTAVIDRPISNSYFYRLDVLFRIINDTGAAEVTQSKLGNRSISVQIVKQ
tara:strand:+ start:5205 stop:6368 length:1164 start_codon:yes stop_codon:yes gene_type:complete